LNFGIILDAVMPITKLSFQFTEVKTFSSDAINIT